MAYIQKEKAALSIHKAVTELAAIIEKIRGIQSLLQQREWCAACASEIEAADLGAEVTAIITATQVGIATPLFTNFIKFLDNNTPSAADYQEKIDQIRDEEWPDLIAD